MFTSATTKSQMHKRPSKNIRNIPLHSSLAGASQMLHMQFLLYLGDSHGQQFTSTNITRRITGSSIRCPNLTVNKGGFPQVCQNVLQWASLIPMLRMTTPQTVLYHVQMCKNSVTAQMPASTLHCTWTGGHFNLIPFCSNVTKIFVSYWYFSQNA